MRAVTRLAESCRNCPFVKDCNHKKLEHLAYYDGPLADAAAGAGASAAQPVMRETMQVNIGGITTTVYKDEIEKELYKAFREPPFMPRYGG